MFYMDLYFGSENNAGKMALLRYKKPGHTVVDPAFVKFFSEKYFWQVFKVIFLSGWNIVGKIRHFLS